MELCILKVSKVSLTRRINRLSQALVFSVADSRPALFFAPLPDWLPTPFRLNNSSTPALQFTNVTIMMGPVQLQVRPATDL